MIKKILDWYYHQKMKRAIVRNKRKDLAVFRILETYLTKIIIEGDHQRRPELAKIQKDIEEAEKFLKFLKTI